MWPIGSVALILQLSLEGHYSDMHALLRDCALGFNVNASPKAGIVVGLSTYLQSTNKAVSISGVSMARRYAILCVSANRSDRACNSTFHSCRETAWPAGDAQRFCSKPFSQRRRQRFQVGDVCSWQWLCPSVCAACVCPPSLVLRDFCPAPGNSSGITSNR